MKWIAILLLAAACAMAQASNTSKRGQTTKRTSPKAATKEYQVNCASVRAQASCESFNEMVARKDKDLLKILGRDRSFVCFRKVEDGFILLSFGRPMFFARRPGVDQSEQPGIFYYDVYKEGQQDSSQVTAGQWTETKTGRETVVEFRPDKEMSDDFPKAFVDDSEVSFSYSFKNLSGTQTNYEMQIRRSTRRFTETFGAPGDQAPGDPSQAKDTGYCAAFK